MRHSNVGLFSFAGISLVHYAEHCVQMYQIRDLCIPRNQAFGLIGGYFPTLVTGESLHAGFALFTLFGFVWLAPLFRGAGQRAWKIGLALSIWHLFEHSLLYGQAHGWFTFFGHGEYDPASVMQLAFPVRRAEIHAAYSILILLAMLIAMAQRHPKEVYAE